MARLDWAVVCDHAYLDRMQQLCLVSIHRELTPPTLPSVLPHLMFIGRLADLQVAEELEVTVAIITPCGGVLIADADSDNMVIQMAREYVIVTVRNLPLAEPGQYSFRMQLGDQPAAVVDLSVRDMAERPVVLH